VDNQPVAPACQPALVDAVEAGPAAQGFQRHLNSEPLPPALAAGSQHTAAAGTAHARTEAMAAAPASL
jgi:hypothetical protein